jgi:Zn-dependent M28 family amino/carboxypeptidase
MIGRNDIGHEKDTNYIYIIGSNMLSDDLHKVNEAANQKYTQLKLDYKFNSLTDPNQFYYRSDHYNFAKHNIPVIFYFSGVHVDYHQPTDDVEKIIFSKVELVARLVYFTAWELANMKRITLNQ